MGLRVKYEDPPCYVREEEGWESVQYQPSNPQRYLATLHRLHIMTSANALHNRRTVQNFLGAGKNSSFKM